MCPNTDSNHTFIEEIRQRYSYPGDDLSVELVGLLKYGEDSGAAKLYFLGEPLLLVEDLNEVMVADGDS